MDASSINEEMAKMEAASRVMMAQNIDADQRREAEAYFIRLRESNITLHVCQTILESTGEPFVIFQLAQCFALSLARNYNSYSDEEVQAACKYLLELPIKKLDLPTYAIAEILKAAAIIYKRGKKCDSDMILTLVTDLLKNPSDAYQSLGLRIIEALCLEHSTFWRNAVTTSYQQHQMAKKRFEEQLLKKFLQVALARSSELVQSGNATAEACERFLRVAVLVLQWNFTASMISSCLNVPLYSFNTLVALRPPPTWSDLFQDEQLLPFFFELHRNVRQNSQLAQHSLACIVQLSGVMGSVLDAPRGTNRRPVQGEIQPHDLYVRRFCTALIDIFKDCHPHELHQFSTSLYRIFSHHPMPIFKRFPRELLGNYIKFIVHWACQLIGPAMNQDKEDDELGLVESLSNVYYAWSVLLRSCPTFSQPIHDLVMEQNSLIIESFVKTVLAPPFGQRTNVSTDDSCEDNEELEDHRLYGIIITDIGVFCRANIDPFVKFIINSFHDRITQRQIVAGGGVSSDQRYLWFEDIHWLLLLIGSFFNDSDKDVGTYLDTAYKKGEYSRTEMHPFFLQCIQQTDSFNAPQNADPVVIICGMVAHWTGILLQSLETQGSASPFVSPEICRSTLRTFASIVNFLTTLNEDQSSFFDEVTSTSSDLGALPSLSTNDELSAQLIDFIIRLCFAIFREFPSEKRLCDIAVCFLTQESEKRAKFIAGSPLLYEKLGSITLERLPCRREFMTCLVTVGSNLSTSQQRSQMHDMILQPMATRFLDAAQAFQSGQFSVAPHLVDLLECFSGIAKGAQIESGNILYAYLLPILHACIRLMPLSADIRTLTDGILDLYKHVATTLFIFVDFKSSETSPAEDQDNFFNLLNALFESYTLSQGKRFRTTSALADIEEEEQISDLVSLLLTISSSITKPYMLFTLPGEATDQSELLLCQKTLEMILPLLNEDALRLPTLSNVFFRLLLNISEASPTVFLMLDNSLAEKLLQCLCWAVGGASGLEPTKLALETIQIICRTLGMSTDTERGPFAYALFNILAGKLFDVALHSSTELEMELQMHAIRGLYSIIRLNPQLFNEYINSVFGRPENVPNYERLINEYNTLVPPTEEMPDTRQAFKAFNTRFEKFATNVESILVV